MTGEPDDSSYLPTDPREFCGRIFHTCYMGTENSSKDTRGRAKALSDAIGGFVLPTFSNDRLRTLTLGASDTTST
jgi:hypothetical protein